MKYGPVFCVLLLMPCASAGVMDFDDLVIWAGSGSNEAALVVDWRDSRPSLAWGFRWDGAATGEDMMRAIVAEDEDFYASINDRSIFGNFVSGLGYDRDGDGFSVTSGVAFDADGLFVGDTPIDGIADDADDSYGESSPSNFGFWEYFVSVDNPFDGGSWNSSSVGFSVRMLSDGDWDAWVYPGFIGNDPPPAPLAAGATPVPEPSTWAAFALLTTGYVIRRTRQRRRKSSDAAA
ncbi:MAG: PEP-CTERM sorting domain-containing protein [Planctomycetaceae bacterium]|nr:PEP-CTERM sorting domain-containing protein [Planctomycetaceae bacterium]